MISFQKMKQAKVFFDLRNFQSTRLFVNYATKIPNRETINRKTNIFS